MFRTIQVYLYLSLYLVVLAVSVVALLDALRRPAAAFVRAGKRTKRFWLLVTGAATAVAFVAVPYPLGIGALSFLALGSAVGATVYLVDVKPAVLPYSGRGGQGGRFGSSGW